jgi:hypothetical protein
VFVHIGGEVVVALRDLVAIIDVASMEKSPLNAQSIQLWSERGSLQRVMDGQVNSWVITTNKVYASPISATTLRKRADDFVKTLTSL